MLNKFEKFFIVNTMPLQVSNLKVKLVFIYDFKKKSWVFRVILLDLDLKMIYFFVLTFFFLIIPEY